MQLVAYLNRERGDATQMSREPWRALDKHPDYKDLVLVECGLRASRVTLGVRQFFRHYRAADCTIEHKSESEQHLAMKRALQDRINAMDGWRGEVEHAHPEREWIADVMAIHVSGPPLAFEVQLSDQSEDEYMRRSQRYADDGVGPVRVVPEDHSEFRIRVPMIVTGFGKTSDLPEDPAELMDRSRYQTMFGRVAEVGASVGAVLHPSFRWPHGTPKYQLEEIARLEEMKARAAAENQQRAERVAEEQRVAAERAAALEVELAARFVEAASSPGARGIPPVLTGRRVWASEVCCMKAGHAMLIWRMTEPELLRPGADDPWAYPSGKFTIERGGVDAWLAAAGSRLVKADSHRTEGPGGARVYACPECQEVIKGRWIAALPPTKWSLIAEGNAPHAQASGVLHTKAPEPPPAPLMREVSTTYATPKPSAQSTQHPAMVEEAEPAFTGPRPWAYWMSEARDAGELAQRLAAKEAHAARMAQLRADPRYRVSPNGFRFECTDCGGMFEDDNEGIHAGGRCMAPGVRRSGWR